VQRRHRRRPTPAGDSPDGGIELGFSERGASERGHLNQIDPCRGLEPIGAIQKPTSPAPDRGSAAGDMAAMQRRHRGCSRVRLGESEQREGVIGPGLGLDPSPIEPGRTVWSDWTSWTQPFGYISLENKII
jgi:hypothetical protein